MHRALMYSVGHVNLILECCLDLYFNVRDKNMQHLTVEVCLKITGKQRAIDTERCKLHVMEHQLYIM